MLNRQNSPRAVEGLAAWLPGCGRRCCEYQQRPTSAAPTVVPFTRPRSALVCQRGKRERGISLPPHRRHSSSVVTAPGAFWGSVLALDWEGEGGGGGGRGARAVTAVECQA
ncbi:hypothetical protein GBF38_019258 [Nibea albiflora]|uniref:Uncharacterized protein n=1 Tax=Nibea albiflora TaxID=240163 RepID=A0ACB7F1Y9_NIBAL|nr:hypothetical protein GBF38_019258 [Nibea albiflora]